MKRRSYLILCFITILLFSLPIYADVLDEMSYPSDPNVYSNIPDEYFKYAAAETVNLQYDNSYYLEQRKNGYFALAYIDDNNIPDLCWRFGETTTVIVTHLNGKPVYNSSYTELGTLNNITHYYYLKKSVYCTAHKENGFVKKSFYEVIPNSDSHLYAYTHQELAYYSDNATYPQYMLIYDKNTRREDTTRAGLISALDKATGNATIYKFVWHKNTEENRKKYLYASQTLADSVTLSKTSVTLTPGQTETLKATASGSVTWKSSDTGVATVKNGKVTAIAPGKATITASVGSASAKCAVVVDKIVVKNMKESSFKTFSKTATDLMKKYENQVPVEKWKKDPYYSMRLLIDGTVNVDEIVKLGAVGVISGPYNITIAQFTSYDETKTAAKSIKKMNGVNFVDTDRCFSCCNDNETSKDRRTSWGVQAIGANEYATNLSRELNGSTNHIKVAVIDSGIDIFHPDLSDRLVSGYDYIDNDNNPNDLIGHGSHVAGIICQCTPGLNIDIMPIKVIDADKKTKGFALYFAFLYAISENADVINISLFNPEPLDFFDNWIPRAVELGIPVIVSAGNDPRNPRDVFQTSPAGVSTAITISSINENEEFSSFSNYGSLVDFCAPGDKIWSCDQNHTYCRRDGTSMSAPHVSALVAMYKLRYPDASVGEIENWMRQNAKDLGPEGKDDHYGYGLVQAKWEYIVATPTDVKLKVGKKKSISAVIKNPNPRTNNRLIWVSNNKKIATVSSSGEITAVSPGTTTVIVKDYNSTYHVSEIIHVRVVETVFNLSVNELTVEKGRYTNIPYVLDETYSTITWKSKNTNIATVDKIGKVTGKKAGTTYITATVDGKTLKCKVTVIEKKAIDISKYLNKPLKNVKSGISGLSYTSDGKTCRLYNDCFRFEYSKDAGNTNVTSIMLGKNKSGYNLLGATVGITKSKFESIMSKKGYKRSSKSANDFINSNNCMRVYYSSAGKVSKLLLFVTTDSKTPEGKTIDLAKYIGRTFEEVNKAIKDLKFSPIDGTGEPWDTAQLSKKYMGFTGISNDRNDALKDITVSEVSLEQDPVNGNYIKGYSLLGIYITMPRSEVEKIIQKNNFECYKGADMTDPAKGRTSGHWFYKNGKYHLGVYYTNGVLDGVWLSLND